MDFTTVTLGYPENISLEGKVATDSCIAVLCNSTLDHIKASIDFWMSDRAGDCGTMLENLNISSDKLVKCSGHVVLGGDNAADKVFRNTEQRLGIHKLMALSAGERIYNSSSSIHRLGQIGLTKLVSPSHADHSQFHYTASL